MSLYRIYVDETGNHDMTHADDPNQRFLALTGVILESEYNTAALKPEMDAIKRQFFQKDLKPLIKVCTRLEQIIFQPSVGKNG